MRGNNSMVINKASMMEAIDFWLRQTVFRDGRTFKVTNVEAERTGSYSDGFKIELEFPAEPDGKTPDQKP